MSLIKDHKVVWKQVAAILHQGFHVEKGEEQSMVHHNRLSFNGFLPRFLKKTIAPHSTAAGGADFRLATDQLPDFRGWLKVQITQGPILRRFIPLPYSLQFVRFIAAEQIAAIHAGTLEAGRTKVVTPSLEKRSVERPPGQLTHERQILLHELLLKIDGMGRKDRLAPLLQPIGHGGQEVGQRFPHPRSGLDDQ